MLTTILLVNFYFIIAISSLTHLSAYSPLLSTLACLEHFFNPRPPPSLPHAVGEKGGDMSNKHKREKMGKIMWRDSTEKVAG